MSENQQSPMVKAATFISTLGPVGFLPKAPGTWGSAVAVIVSPFLFYPFTLPVRIAILVLLFIFGALASTQAEKSLGTKDPGCVIIDEVLGQWVTFTPFVIMTGWQFITGFILFRIFDILKPWPVRQSENWLKSGWGIMIDDAIAGIYAAICLWLIRMI
jgi:phosphatidylglycerophosphatase A